MRKITTNTDFFKESSVSSEKRSSYEEETVELAYNLNEKGLENQKEENKVHEVEVKYCCPTFLQNVGFSSRRNKG